MIDFHTHILPGIDDGSPDVQTSLRMLVEEVKTGVDTVVLTPHFRASKDSIDRFLRDRNESYEKLASAILSRKMLEFPKLHLGAEVTYFNGIGKASDVSKLCIEGTKTLLLELPRDKWGASVFSDVKELINSQGLDIVLAHLERYVDVPGYKKDLSKLLTLPVTVQINAGSLLKSGKRKKEAISLLKTARHTLLSSDCHNLTTRKPNLKAGYMQAEVKLRPGYTENAAKLCKNLLNL